MFCYTPLLGRGEYFNNSEESYFPSVPNIFLNTQSQKTPGEVPCLFFLRICSYHTPKLGIPRCLTFPIYLIRRKTLNILIDPMMIRRSLTWGYETNDRSLICFANTILFASLVLTYLLQTLKRFVPKRNWKLDCVNRNLTSHITLHFSIPCPTIERGQTKDPQMQQIKLTKEQKTKDTRKKGGKWNHASSIRFERR